MAGSTTSPLAPAQQRFLQRLLASHALTDEEALEVWESCNSSSNSSSTLPLATINEQLTAGFGLEIGSIKLHGTKYHTIINQHADENTHIVESMTEYTPHERAYIRAVLEHIVTSNDNDDDDEESPSVTRMDLINLRTTMSKPYHMLSIEQATHVLDRLVDEYWLVLKDGDSKGPARRQSRMKEEYQLGPRTYLELSSLLVDLGCPEEKLPQFLYHRS